MQDEKQIDSQEQGQHASQENDSDHAVEIENAQQLELSSSLFKFKPVSQQNCYLPEFKSRSKQSQVEVSYRYKETVADHMGSLDEEVEQKPQSSLKIGSQVMSENPDKGVQYTVFMKKTGEKKSGEGAQMRAQAAFGCENILNYFEVKIQQSLENDNPSFEIGITSCQNPANNRNSITLSVKFKGEGEYEVYRNKRKIEEFNDTKLQVGDVVGLGLIYHKNEVFLVLKGKKKKLRFELCHGQEATQKITKDKKSPVDFINLHNHKYFPYITIHSQGIALEAKFDNSKSSFCFDYESETKSLMKKLVENKIEKQFEMNQASVYGLVLNYLKFNGYEKSTQLLESEMTAKNIKFHPQNQPTKEKSKNSHLIDHVTSLPGRKEISRDKKIRKKNKNSNMGRERRNSSDDQGYFEFEEQNNSNQKSHSEDDGYEGGYNQMFLFHRNDFPNFLSKRDEGLQFQQEHEPEENMLNLRRKQKKQTCEFKSRKVCKKAESFKKNELQKFKTERIQIIRSIKQAKLQLAYKILSKSYKRICKHQKYLEVFFKANIFLRLFFEQGLSSAVEFAKKENSGFTMYENYLFPFWNPKSVEDKFENQVIYRPLREILFLISPSKPTNFQFKSHLQIFSQFVNKILCEESGFHSKSQLQLVLNHFQAAQNMVVENEISIGGIDTDSVYFA